MHQGKTARRYFKFSSGYLCLLGLDMGLILCYSYYFTFLLLSLHYTYSQGKNVSLLLLLPLKKCEDKMD